jgi:hypothetical protein
MGLVRLPGQYLSNTRNTRNTITTFSEINEKENPPRHTIQKAWPCTTSLPVGETWDSSCLLFVDEATEGGLSRPVA